MKDVVDLTKGLFTVSKVLSFREDLPIAYVVARQETAKLEAEIFERRQQVAMAGELKSVLDSWVRYEQQAKEAEQAQLARTVIDKVLKSLQDEKAQKDILLGAVTEVERTCFYGYSDFNLCPIPQNWSRTKPFD
jgi:F-type H+-transporting ATPase subunit b